MVSPLSTLVPFTWTEIANQGKGIMTDVHEDDTKQELTGHDTVVEEEDEDRP